MRTIVEIGEGKKQRAIPVDIQVSSETATLKDKQYRLVRHVGSGFQYLATPDAIEDLSSEVENYNNVVGELEMSLEDEAI
tara:strand:- start:210 stop:449 length:240 start_codon:yes stop_codon:yes gene_type:complete